MSGPDGQIFYSHPTRHVTSIPIYLDTRIRNPQAGLSSQLYHRTHGYPTESAFFRSSLTISALLSASLTLSADLGVSGGPPLEFVSHIQTFAMVSVSLRPEFVHVAALLQPHVSY